MAKGFSRIEMQRFALLGARARLAELDAERASLLRAFPGLRRGGGSVGESDNESGGAEPKAGRRRRRRMSAAGRKRISEMMKRRWAERRKAR